MLAWAWIARGRSGLAEPRGGGRSGAAPDPQRQNSAASSGMGAGYTPAPPSGHRWRRGERRAKPEPSPAWLPGQHPCSLRKGQPRGFPSSPCGVGVLPGF